MVEIDSDTYQVKMVQAAATPRFLMTPERSQNLQLVQHLFANFEQAIALCGPEGVGKTAFLGVLQKRLQDEWRWCLVNGQGGMTFEDVRDRIESLLKPRRLEAPVSNGGAGHGRSPDAHQSVVVVIDDAGEMAPGLLTRLIQFAEKHSDLRLLFVLTHDQWHIKSCSDPAIESCFIVEAKPLREKECRDFVQHIASLSASLRYGKGLEDSMIDAAYRQSHGIPGKMMACFPELNKTRVGPDSFMILIIGVVGLVSLALFLQWFTASRQDEKNVGVATFQPDESRAHVDLQQPILSLPVGDALKNAQPPDSPAIQREGTVSMDAAGQAVGANQPALTAIVQPEVVRDAAVSPVASPDPAEQAKPAGDVESWLAARPESNYGLQLMVIAKAAAIQAVIARHPKLQAELRVLRGVWRGKKKFVLLYGDFADVESASNAKKALPAEFKSAMIRKFAEIRKEFPSAPSP